MLTQIWFEKVGNGHQSSGLQIKQIGYSKSNSSTKIIEEDEILVERKWVEVFVSNKATVDVFVWWLGLNFDIDRTAVVIR